jgi:AGZA family xanthine/uracil permease-like MFS transporter
MKRWFVRGDIDGFFALALDNLVQLLLIDALCRYVLGFSQELVSGRILPGVAISLVIGNFFYAYQARKLMEQTGRDDICALPYGINTVSLFAHVFLVMLPAKFAALAAGAADPATVAWQAGLVACLGSGLIELAGSFVSEPLRRMTPRAALLSTLAGIALGFISLGFLFRTFAYPLVGFSTLAIVLLVFFGGVRFKGGIPGGMVAVALGTAIAWAVKEPAMGSSGFPGLTGFSFPQLWIGDILTGLSAGALVGYISVILPMGLFNVVGSLQNIESAEAAGDRFPTAPSLAVNGIGTIAAAMCGSCFPTTIYIGHPGWKALGSRAGYSVLNGLFMAFICLTGTLSALAWAIPIEAGMAIVIWIGLVISAQAFQATPRSHAPAVVVGLLPGLAAWGVLMAKGGLRAAGMGAPGPPFTEELIAKFKVSDIYMDGGFALEQGFIFTSIIWAAATVAIIERSFHKAGLWVLAGALLSAVGLMHGYQFTPGDVVVKLGFAQKWVWGYLAAAAVLFLAPYITEPENAGASHGTWAGEDQNNETAV